MDGYFAEYAYLSGGTASFNVLSVGPESYGSELPIQRGANGEHYLRHLTPGQIFFKIID